MGWMLCTLFCCPGEEESEGVYAVCEGWAESGGTRSIKDYILIWKAL